MRATSTTRLARLAATLGPGRRRHPGRQVGAQPVHHESEFEGPFDYTVEARDAESSMQTVMAGKEMRVTEAAKVSSMPNPASNYPRQGAKAGAIHSAIVSHTLEGVFADCRAAFSRPIVAEEGENRSLLSEFRVLVLSGKCCGGYRSDQRFR